VAALALDWSCAFKRERVPGDAHVLQLLARILPGTGQASTANARKIADVTSGLSGRPHRVASAREHDGVSAHAVVFTPDYGSEDVNEIGSHVSSRRRASATSPGSLAPAA